MQALHCAICDTSPLDPPRLAGGHWHALCPGCGSDNLLEAENQNVFLPMRFRVATRPGGAQRSAGPGDTLAQPTPA